MASTFRTVFKMPFKILVRQTSPEVTNYRIHINILHFTTFDLMLKRTNF